MIYEVGSFVQPFIPKIEVEQESTPVVQRAWNKALSQGSRTQAQTQRSAKRLPGI